MASTRTFQCIDCDRVWPSPRPESCECGGDFMREIPSEEEEEAAKLLREASYVVRKAELTEMIGTDKPWEEREDEPLTLADFRRLPPGSDERELILAHLLIDIWNEVDHLRHHVCPHADEDDEEGD